MYLSRILPAGDLAAFDFSGLGGLGISAGPTRFTTPGPTRSTSVARPGHVSRADDDARRRRHEQRVREQEVQDRRQREEDFGGPRRGR